MYTYVSTLTSQICMERKCLESVLSILYDELIRFLRKLLSKEPSEAGIEYKREDVLRIFNDLQEITSATIILPDSVWIYFITSLSLETDFRGICCYM